MSVIPFPEPRRVPIADPADIAAIEQAISAVAGAIAASGGGAAIAGRDLYETSVEGRALLLTDMYDAGEVIFGWRDGRDGAVVNIALEKLAVAEGSEERRCWRALVYVEEPEGHILRGGFVEGDLGAMAARLFGAAQAGAAAPPPPRPALAAFLRGTAEA